MEIILLERIANLGPVGHVVKVKKGYARNYLIPYGKADFVTDEVMAKVEVIKAEIAKKEASELEKAKIRGQSLDNLSIITFKMKANKEKLFGSISAKDVIAALAEKGAEVDKSELVDFHPLRNLGEHSVPVKVHKSVTAVVKVMIQAESEEEDVDNSEADSPAEE